MEHSLTVAEIATAITDASAKSWRSRLTVSDARFGKLIAEEQEILIRRIRNWTVAGALLPIGATHSGTGKHRRYGIEAVYETAILHRLADWSLPIGILKAVVDRLRPEMARGKGKQLWDDAVAGRQTVFLSVAPWAAPDRGTSSTPEILLALFSDGSTSRFSESAGAVLLNLSVIFRDICL